MMVAVCKNLFCSIPDAHCDCPLSAQAWAAEALSSMSRSMPATNTPSSLSNAKFSRSQLRLLMRKRERQALSNAKHSLASAGVGEVTKSSKMKLDAIVKLVRVSE